MKRVRLVCTFLVIVSTMAAAQELAVQRPDIVGRWRVAESWDLTLNDRLEIAESEVLRGFDSLWVFKDNQELYMIDPVHMVDPIRQTYVYHWRWLNDTTVCITPGSKDIYLLCHLLDYSPSLLVFASGVEENEHRHESPSLYVLRVLKKINPK